MFLAGDYPLPPLTPHQCSTSVIVGGGVADHRAGCGAGAAALDLEPKVKSPAHWHRQYQLDLSSK